METYESEIQKISAEAHTVYQALGNLNNIEKVQHLIPQDKVQEITFGEDFVRFKVDGLGQKICIRIVDREEDKMLKFGAENIPIQMNFWVQLKQVAPQDTRIKLTLKAELPMMLKMMMGSKLQSGLDEAAKMLARMPFNEWQV